MGSPHAPPSYTTILCVAVVGVLLFLTLYCLIKCVSRAWTSMMQARVTKALLKRRNTKDDFRDVNGYSWDFVMAFKVRL